MISQDLAGYSFHRGRPVSAIPYIQILALHRSATLRRSAKYILEAAEGRPEQTGAWLHQVVSLQPSRCREWNYTKSLPRSCVSTIKYLYPDYSFSNFLPQSYWPSAESFSCCNTCLASSLRAVCLGLSLYWFSSEVRPNLDMIIS